jgi:hypothetical protein
MRTESNVLVSVGTPLQQKASRGVFPAKLTIGECLDEVVKSEPADPAERRVVQQVRREIGAARFDIMLVMQGGGVEKVQPGQRLGDLATQREVQRPGGPEKFWAAQLELQSYAPVGGL